MNRGNQQQKGSVMCGPPSELEGVKVTYHYDEHGDEWVVRLHAKDGSYSPVAGCPGEIEAKTVAAAFVFGLAMMDITWDIHEEVFITAEGGAFNRVEVNEKALDGFVAAQDLGHESAALIKEMLS
jgi:hypothetical protein|tara:strand:+ start:33 stop:407 length:375 start_codon:yes stop_codon:yes gene_type:complete